MVWNVLVRFDWVWNFPVAGREARLRSWLFALAEILRRWVWNFFRVETEHLGNSDTYRSDRPAPVRRLVTSSDQPNSRNAHKGVMPVGFYKLERKLVGTEAGRGPDALNVGARGRAATREYESRRPGDASASDDEPTV
jgi:hypothetical protein